MLAPSPLPGCHRHAGPGPLPPARAELTGLRAGARASAPPPAAGRAGAGGLCRVRQAARGWTENPLARGLGCWRPAASLSGRRPRTLILGGSRGGASGTGQKLPGGLHVCEGSVQSRLQRDQGLTVLWRALQPLLGVSAESSRVLRTSAPRSVSVWVGTREADPREAGAVEDTRAAAGRAAGQQGGGGPPHQFWGSAHVPGDPRPLRAPGIAPDGQSSRLTPSPISLRVGSGALSVFSQGNH